MCWAAGLLGCWADRLGGVLVSCWAVGLMGWAVGLMGWAVGLGCWAVGLMGCWVVGLLGCQEAPGEVSCLLWGGGGKYPFLGCLKANPKDRDHLRASAKQPLHPYMWNEPSVSLSQNGTLKMLFWCSLRSPFKPPPSNQKDRPEAKGPPRRETPVQERVQTAWKRKDKGLQFCWVTRPIDSGQACGTCV